ncbi:LysE family transporter, partial [Streptomyces sp. NPDC056295]|uniref:LysE family transporter n=1 Tax=Streptomyces sp. NPDC056295 TaxID=3345774 RepID=UPI0035DFF60F
NILHPPPTAPHAYPPPTLAPSALPPHLGMALLVLLHVALTLAWLGGYVMVLVRARTFFERPSVRRAMDRVTGVVLIGFGIKVATSQP